MSDGINTINLGGSSARLGAAIGTGLSSGLEALAKMKLKSIHEDKQAQALAPFIGNNLDLAKKIMTLPEKERMVILQNLPNQGGQNYGQGSNTGQGGNTGQGQGFNIFAKQPTPISLYQQKQLEIDERKAVAAEEKNKNILSAQQAKDSNIFYEKHVEPYMEEAEGLTEVNQRLESIVNSSSGISTFDRIAEGFKDSSIPFASNLATFLQSDAAALAIKSRAQFLGGYSKAIKGAKPTEFIVNAYMKQYPDPVIQGQPTIEALALDIIRMNNFKIKNANLRHSIFEDDPKNTDLFKFNSKIKEYNAYEKELSKKKNKEPLTDQNEDQQNNFPEVEPSQDLMPQQPEQAQQVPQPEQVPQQIPQAVPQQVPQQIPQQIPQAVPQQTQDSYIQEAYKNYEMQREKEKQELRLTPEEKEVEKAWKSAKKVEGKPLIDLAPITKKSPALSATLQIALPTFARWGDDIKSLIRHLPKGNYKEIAEGIRENFAPTVEEAEKTLLKLGVTQEEIDNPSLFVDHMKNYFPTGAALLTAAVVGGPISVVTVLGAMAAGMTLPKIAEIGGEIIGGEKGKDISRVLTRVASPAIGAKLAEKGFQSAEKVVKKYKYETSLEKEGIAQAKKEHDTRQANVDAEKNRLEKAHLDDNTKIAADLRKMEAGGKIEHAQSFLPTDALTTDQRYDLYDQLSAIQIVNPIAANQTNYDVAEINKTLSTIKPSEAIISKLQADTKGTNYTYKKEKNTELYLKELANKARDIKKQISDPNTSSVGRTYLYKNWEIIRDFLVKHGGEEYADLIKPANELYSKTVAYNFAAPERLQMLHLKQKEAQTSDDLKGESPFATLKAMGGTQSVADVMKEFGGIAAIKYLFGVPVAVGAKAIRSFYKGHKVKTEKIDFITKTYPKLTAKAQEDFIANALNPSKSNLSAANHSLISLFTQPLKEKEEKDKNKKPFVLPEAEEIDRNFFKKNK
jgi:hypothetical protein